MLNTAKIVAFVPIRDSQKSRPFYESVLGLRFVSDDPFALVMESNGIMVRLAKTPNFTPAGFTVMGWEISKIEEEAAALQKKGVTFEKFPGLQQEESGIWTAPGGAKVAWFKDPDGNILSLSQHV
ncbi:MAG TPA: VOC family protein [Candidatus Angelobacter sp.]|jgi:catechol 2,3-dioxygenase-like lactoylglutathione lyase family enzyme